MTAALRTNCSQDTSRSRNKNRLHVDRRGSSSHTTVRMHSQWESTLETRDDKAAKNTKKIVPQTCLKQAIIRKVVLLTKAPKNVRTLRTLAPTDYLKGVLRGDARLLYSLRCWARVSQRWLLPHDPDPARKERRGDPSPYTHMYNTKERERGRFMNVSETYS